MTFKSKVKVTVSFSTKKAYNSAMLMVRTLKLSRDVGPHQWMVLRAKVKVTRTFNTKNRGWSGGAKVLCILHHRGVQLILAYSWARPAILVVGKDRGGLFLFLLFLHFHSCSSFFPVPLFYLFYCLFYLFSPFLWETTQNDPQGLTCR